MIRITQNVRCQKPVAEALREPAAVEAPNRPPDHGGFTQQPVGNLSERDLRIYDVLKHAAENGQQCPTSMELCRRFGFSGPGAPRAGGTIPRILWRLEKAGLIAVERYLQHRVVTITETGLKTAAPPNPRPHWRQRKAA